MAWHIPANNPTISPERDSTRASDTRMGSLPVRTNKTTTVTRPITLDPSTRSPMIYDQELIDSNTSLENSETRWWRASSAPEHFQGNYNASAGNLNPRYGRGQGGGERGYAASLLVLPTNQMALPTNQMALPTRFPDQLVGADILSTYTALNQYDQQTRRYGGRYGPGSRVDRLPPPARYPSVDTVRRAELWSAVSPAFAAAMPQPVPRQAYVPPDYRQMWEYQERSRNARDAHLRFNERVRANQGGCARNRVARRSDTGY